MRRVAMLVLTMVFCLGLTNQGIAGPFGLAMGMQPADLGRKLGNLKNPGEYHTTEVPTPHSSFEGYGLLFGPKTGLCQIVAVTKNVATSAYGSEFIIAFDSLEKRLQSQYGKSQKFDFLRKGSDWKAPHDFMMGLLKKERVLVTAWNADSGAALKDHLQVIAMVAQALSSEVGYTEVRYDFENVKECLKELTAAEDDAL